MPVFRKLCHGLFFLLSAADLRAHLVVKQCPCCVFCWAITTTSGDQPAAASAQLRSRNFGRSIPGTELMVLLLTASQSTH